MIVPSKLLDLSKLPGIQVQVLKNVNIERKNRNQKIILLAKDVLENAFVTSEKALINDLFSSIGESGNFSIIAVSYRAEEVTVVIAVAVFDMCVQGGYVSYIAVVEKDLMGITASGYFWECGLARFVVIVIQLVTFATHNTWDLFCWSNNSKKKRTCGSNSDSTLLKLLMKSLGLKKLKQSQKTFIYQSHMP